MLSLPSDIIYTIARADYVVYNRLLRTCRAIYDLFPLSRRLDYMIDFGVSIRMHSTMHHGELRSSQILIWMLNGKAHSVWGPASVWADGSYTYWRHGRQHRAAGPSRVWRNNITWHRNDAIWRDPADIAGAGVAPTDATMITPQTYRNATGRVEGVSTDVLEQWLIAEYAYWLEHQ